MIEPRPDLSATASSATRTDVTCRLRPQHTVLLGSPVNGMVPSVGKALLALVLQAGSPGGSGQGRTDAIDPASHFLAVRVVLANPGERDSGRPEMRGAVAW